ncbi:MAG: hypothetical protein BGO43_02370 [Gammaproteobacteria bacterium 39-13]|nr:hypothetical protein [Gammaproteobacteria bacterium]OJV91135.1 MAG: hypothetical protein BGO43_02370 [Gammaproteobacteria bacterium 39-13]
MKKRYVNAGIIKTTEDGVTIITILGLENYPQAYKQAYLEIAAEIQKNMVRIISRGESPPVIRINRSLEIH